MPSSSRRHSLWIALVWLVCQWALPLVAVAQPTPAERAAGTAMVPLEEVQQLELPSDELSLDEDLLGLPIVRMEVKVAGTLWTSKPGITSVKFGEKLSAEAARRAMRELGDGGGFVQLAAEVERAGSGVLLRIVAVPARRLAAVQVEGGVLDRTGTLRAAGVAVGTELTEAALADLPAKVRQHYDKHGFPRATVKTRAASLDDPLSIMLVISITPNEPRLVAQRIFVIEPKYDAHVGELKFEYAVKAGERLDQYALDEADRTLSQSLREAGFYKARVSHKLKHVGVFSYLYVYVESGPKLVPSFEGNRAFDRHQLRTALDLGKGQVGSIEELSGKIAKFYEQHGFLDAEVSGEVRSGPDQGLEHVVFEVREHQRVVVERRIFACLDKAIDPDDVGGEIDDVLETELPDETFVSLPSPRLIDGLVGSSAPAGSRPGQLSLSPENTYTAEVYGKALKRVREVYLSKGYLNAQIGPVTVMRARCAKDSPAGACIEEPLPKIVAQCATDAAGLPLPEPPTPRSATCVPDPLKGVRCSPRVTLRIPVHLGPVTKVWDVAFEGNRHATDKSLAAVADLELGAPLSTEKLEDAKRRILEHYQDRGYAYAGISSEIDLSPDKSRARVRFVLTERDLVFIEDIEIEGATRTDHALILRRISFKKGDVYSREKVRLSEERLATLGVFSSASVTLAEPEVVSRKKILVVRVAEYPSQYIEPRVGFSTGEGLRFGFEYGHRNIASLGISLTLRIQLSYLFDFIILDSDFGANLRSLPTSQRLERRNSVRIAFPEIGLGPLVSFGIEAIDVRDNQRDFGLTRDAIVPSLTYRPFRELVGTLSASVELNDEQIFSGASVDEAIKQNPALEQLLRFPDGTTFAVAQRISLAWDRRDAPFNATSGTLLTLEVEHVNAFPADTDDPDTDPLVSHFLKLSARFGGYVRLTRGGIAVAASVGVGANVQLASGSRTYPDRLFFLGGFDSMRSFQANSLVPEDVAEEIENPPSGTPEDERLTIDDVGVRGGDLSFNPRLELRLPFTETFALGVFLDAGNLWVDPMAFNPVDLRYGLGAGLRIATPIGPLAFDYGFNLDPRPWEDVGALHFSIGLF